MHSISKRQFVISAAAAGAAFGLDGPLAFIPPAEAQKAPPSNPIGAPQALVDKGVVDAFLMKPGSCGLIAIPSKS